MYPHWAVICNDRTTQGKMSIAGGAEGMVGNMGTLYFLFNVFVNLKLLYTIKSINFLKNNRKFKCQRP